jgi:cell division protein FtsB
MVPRESRLDAPPAGTTRRGRHLLRLVLIFVTVVLFINALAGEKGLLALMEARNELATVERSLLRARAENARLREEARRLREDPAAIEELARRDLGMIKPGEKLFIIRDVPPPK